MLYADGKTAVMDGADLGKVKVEAVVAEHVKGDEDPGHHLPAEEALPKRRMGHRSHLTRLEIQEDQLGRPRRKSGAGRRSRHAARPSTEEKED